MGKYRRQQGGGEEEEGEGVESRKRGKGVKQSVEAGRRWTVNIVRGRKWNWGGGQIGGQFGGRREQGGTRGELEGPRGGRPG